ncbi:MAG: 16S rRNA (guanine(966)-N(2))-methyltransferase RsmD [Gammaproteobacteria bacterium]|nr:16S rRNA (guanine(966)-N(2))-methyltransferase RsmD [Gammaproteobacteria bacterium]
MQQNSFRIIAGQWRGRRLPFPANTTVRPTGDRVRETVFNWLQPYVSGARVLDLFAGTGALGLEALSRGAANVTFVEKDPRLSVALKRNLATVNAQAAVISADVMEWLQRNASSWNIIFLDPPYPANLWLTVFELLRNKGLRDGTLIYTEQPAGDPMLNLPSDFAVLKERTAGQVRFMLLRYEPV